MFYLNFSQIAAPLTLMLRIIKVNPTITDPVIVGQDSIIDGVGNSKIDKIKLVPKRLSLKAKINAKAKTR